MKVPVGQEVKFQADPFPLKANSLTCTTAGYKGETSRTQLGWWALSQARELRCEHFMLKVPRQASAKSRRCRANEVASLVLEVGRIKTFHAEKGFGFIVCEALNLQGYQGDVFLHHRHKGSFEPGDEVAFMAVLRNGKLQGKDLQVAWNQSPSERGTESGLIQLLSLVHAIGPSTVAMGGSGKGSGKGVRKSHGFLAQNPHEDDEVVEAHLNPPSTFAKMFHSTRGIFPWQQWRLNNRKNDGFAKRNASSTKLSRKIGWLNSHDLLAEFEWLSKIGDDEAGPRARNPWVAGSLALSRDFTAMIILQSLEKKVWAGADSGEAKAVANGKAPMGGVTYPPIQTSSAGTDTGGSAPDQSISPPEPNEAPSRSAPAEPVDIEEEDDEHEGEEPSPEEEVADAPMEDEEADEDQAIYTSTLGLGILSTLGILSPVAPEIAAQLKDLSSSLDFASAYWIFLSLVILRFLLKYEQQLRFTAEHLMAYTESLSYLSSLDWYAQSEDQWLSGISERLSYFELRVDRAAGDPFDVFRHLAQDIADFDESASGSMIFKVVNPQADDPTQEFKYEWDLLLRTALLALSNEIFYYRLLLVPEMHCTEVVALFGS
ncbi:hypothetical protein AK812_SmicGene13195 [Symbiodinium microadriaticum]|uniref:Cold-shock domain-containing protein n=1 Tax=Symbiodinium microadriaticum TaxID=2951 RepID=A0A1Q9E8R9_SYMMI|nr:hypothetical protein AK812_SmicGene13195 [Symbiodinium microadriaticum]